MNQLNQYLLVIRKHMRISNNLKNQLIELVMLKDLKIKKASILLGIKYSTAKNIINRYRKAKIQKKPDSQISLKRCRYKPINNLSNPIKLVCTKAGLKIESS